MTLKLKAAVTALLILGLIAGTGTAAAGSCDYIENSDDDTVNTNIEQTYSDDDVVRDNQVNSDNGELVDVKDNNILNDVLSIN